MLRECLELHRFKAESKGLILAEEIPNEFNGATFNTDGNRLKQILINLLSNAVKYTQRGSVRVVPIVDNSKTTLKISVIDTGVGIKSDKLD